MTLGERITLAEQIISYRAKHELSQKRFGEKCGLSRFTIMQAERDGRISPVSAEKIRLVIDGK